VTIARLIVEKNRAKTRSPRGDCSHIPTSYISYLPGVGRATVWSPQEGKGNQRRDDKLPARVDHPLRVSRTYEQATTSTTVGASWVKTEFQYEERDNNWCLTVHEAEIPSSTGFREI
jgi:hypothetical protein